MEKYLDLARELKNTVEDKDDGGTNCSWYVWNGSQSFREKTGRNGNQWKNRDPTKSIITEIR